MSTDMFVFTDEPTEDDEIQFTDEPTDEGEFQFTDRPEGEKPKLLSTRTLKETGKSVVQGFGDIYREGKAFHENRDIDAELEFEKETGVGIQTPMQRLQESKKVMAGQKQGQPVTAIKKQNRETERAELVKLLDEKIASLPEMSKESSGRIEDAMKGMARFLPTIGVSALDPIAGVALTFAQLRGQKYEELIENGDSKEAAFANATFAALANTPLEMAGNLVHLNVIRKGAAAIGGKLKIGQKIQKFVGGLLASSSAEGVEEFLQTYPDQLASYVSGHPEMSADELVEGFKAELPRIHKQAVDSAKTGAVGGAFMPLAGGAIGLTGKAVDSAGEKLQDKRAELADKYSDSADVENGVPVGDTPANNQIKVVNDLNEDAQKEIHLRDGDKFSDSAFSGFDEKADKNGTQIKIETVDNLNNNVSKSDIEAVKTDAETTNRVQKAAEQRQREIQAQDLEAKQADEQQQQQKLEALKTQKLRDRADVERAKSQQFMDAISTEDGVMHVTSRVLTGMEQSKEAGMRGKVKALRDAHKALAKGTLHLEQLKEARYNLRELNLNSTDKYEQALTHSLDSLISARIEGIEFDERQEKLSAEKMKQDKEAGKAKVAEQVQARKRSEQISKDFRKQPTTVDNSTQVKGAVAREIRANEKASSVKTKNVSSVTAHAAIETANKTSENAAARIAAKAATEKQARLERQKTKIAELQTKKAEEKQAKAKQEAAKVAAKNLETAKASNQARGSEESFQTIAPENLTALRAKRRLELSRAKTQAEQIAINGKYAPLLRQGLKRKAETNPLYVNGTKAEGGTAAPIKGDIKGTIGTSSKITTQTYKSEDSAKRAIRKYEDPLTHRVEVDESGVAPVYRVVEKSVKDWGKAKYKRIKSAFNRVSHNKFIAERDKTARPEFITPHEKGEMKNWKSYLTADGIGYQLTDKKDIVGVINNSGKRGAGQEALVQAIKNGGKTLDCIDGFLDEYYPKFGFEMINRVDWEDRYAPKGWNYEEHGRPTVSFWQWPTGLSRSPADVRRRFESAGRPPTSFSGHTGTTVVRSRGGNESTKTAQAGMVQTESETADSRTGTHSRDVESSVPSTLFKKQVEKKLSQARALLKKATSVEVHSTPTEMTGKIGKQIARDKAYDSKALYDPNTKTVHIFTDNITDLDDAKKTLFHELGHFSLQDLLGKDRVKPLLEAIADKYSTEVGKRIAFYEYADTQSNREREAEEILIELYESGTKSTIVDRLKNLLTKFVRKLGFQSQITEAEMKQLATQIRENLQKGKTKEIKLDSDLKDAQVRYQAEAFHGSPHDVTKSKEGKFSTKHVGTGEGVQAFGWGLYFTEKEDIAKHYANALAPAQAPIMYKGERIDIGVHKRSAEQQVAFTIAKGMERYNTPAEKAKQQLIDFYQEDLTARAKDPNKAVSSMPTTMLKNMLKAAKIVDLSQIDFEKKHNLYKVTLHKGKEEGKDYNWLDWDKKGSSSFADKIETYVKDYQKKIGKAQDQINQEYQKSVPDKFDPLEILMHEHTKEEKELQKVADAIEAEYPYIVEEATQEKLEQFAKQYKRELSLWKEGDTRYDYDILYGNQAYESLSRILGSNKNASLFLSRIGVDGIRYPTESLSGRKSNKSNYVVFDENAVTVEEHQKYKRGDKWKDTVKDDEYRTHLKGLNQKAPKIIDTTKMKWWEKLIWHTADGLYPLTKLEAGQNLTDATMSGYKSIRMLSSFPTMFKTVMNNGIPVYDEHWMHYEKKEYGGLNTVIKRLGDEEQITHFFKRMQALRVNELIKEKGKKNVLSENDQHKIDMLLRGTDPYYQKNKELWDTTTKQLKEINTSILDFCQHTGMINAEARKGWESNFYIPLTRVMTDPKTDTFEVVFKKAGGKDVKNIIDTLKGSEKEVADPYMNLINTYSFMLNEALMNISRKKSIKTCIDAGIAKRVPAALRGTKSTVVYHEGKAQHFQIDDTVILDTIVNLNAATEGQFSKFFTVPKRILTRLVAENPAFRVANLFRDTIHTSFVEKSFVPFVDTAIGGWHALKNDDVMKEFAMTGGAFTGSYAKRYDRTDVQKSTKQFYNDTLDKGIGHKISKYTGYAFWERIGEASENAARVGVYKKNRAAGKSKFESGFQAKDLLDFHLSGQHSWVQHAIHMVPFLNARIQGLYKIGRSGGKVNRANLLLNIGLMSVFASMLHAYNSDNDDYNDLPLYQKMLYWHIYTPVGHFRLPKPFEIGAIASMQTQLFDYSAGKSDGGDLWNAAKFVVTSMFEVGLPQVIKPFQQQYSNKDTFTGRAVDPMKDFNVREGEHYGPNTSNIAKLAGDKFNVSPYRIDQFLKDCFGYGAKLGTTIADSFVDAMDVYPDDPAMSQKWLDACGVKRFHEPTGTTPKYLKQTEKFYEYMREVDEVYNTLGLYERNKEHVKAREWKKEHRSELRGHTALSSLQKRIKAINAKMRLTYHLKMTREAKQERLDNLLKKRNRLIKRAAEKADRYKGRK